MGIAVGGTPTATVTIEESDDAHGKFQFNVQSQQITVTEPADGEAHLPVGLIVTRTRGLFGTASVKCQALTTSSDVLPTEGNPILLFAENVTEQACVFFVVADLLPELEETVTIGW